MDVNKLKSKLSDEDIAKCEAECKRFEELYRLNLEISAGKAWCKECPYAEERLRDFVYIQGNINSKVMVVASTPSQYECINHAPMTDIGGGLLSVIIEKLSVAINKPDLRRDSLYITHINKCSAKDSIAIDTCCSNYITREIELVKPKVIIILGEAAVYSFRRIMLGILDEEDDFDDLRGKVNNVDINGLSTKVIYALDPTEVLSKAGSMYETYKKMLWVEFKTAFTHI